MNMVGVPCIKEHLWEEKERKGKAAELKPGVGPALHPSPAQHASPAERPSPAQQSSSTGAGTTAVLFLHAHIHTYVQKDT